MELDNFASYDHMFYNYNIIFNLYSNFLKNNDLLDFIHLMIHSLIFIILYSNTLAIFLILNFILMFSYNAYHIINNYNINCLIFIFVSF